MKHYKYLLPLLAVILLLLPSCRRAFMNGELDGNWKIERIDNLQTGESVDYPKFPGSNLPLIYGIELELMQLNTGGVLNAQGKSATAVIHYDKSGKTLTADFAYFMRSDDPAFPNSEQQAILNLYGIYENPVTFHIETLNNSHLILLSPQSRITLVKF